MTTDNIKQNLVSTFAGELSLNSTDLMNRVFSMSVQEMNSELVKIRNLAEDGLAVLDTLK